MILFGLDIPDGLEQLFANVVQLAVSGENYIAGLTLPASSFPKKQILRGRSIFVALAPTYDGLSDDRKSAWTTYWATLPFGTHSGAGGWPGSGFSAFSYVNAPLYVTGADLILDAPGFGGELVLNPAFVTDDSNWTENGWSWLPGVFTAVAADEDASIQGALATLATVFATRTFHLEFEAHGSGLLYAFLYNLDSANFTDVPSFESPDGIIDYDLTLNNGLSGDNPDSWIIAFTGDPDEPYTGTVNSVSVVMTS